MTIKNLSVRIDNELLDKLHYVASYNGRSANSQVIKLIRQYIDNFEKQHGDIPINQHLHK
ncbi:MAG: Arc family DNA-binding protein [Clostridiales bacterium]|nr:Arc family DNA-binding protein [Clostridiales bacterium]